MSHVFSEEIQNKCRNPQLRELFQNYIVSQIGTPVNGVASQGTLTLSGVVIDGETITIGTDIYEMCSDVAQTVTPGNIAVDITSGTTASAGLLTVAVQPLADDTMTIGTKVYTFTADGTASTDGEIDVGSDLADCKTLIVSAINGTDGINTAHTLVSCGDFSTNDAIITALIGGTSGDAIATTETFDDVGNIFDAATLGTEVAGVDCTAADADGYIIAADEGTIYSMAQGTGTTIVVTAATKGVAGDLIATTETMANGVFDAATLGTTTSGVDGTVGSKGQEYIDSSYKYVCIADNAITDTNWRRISLGSAY